MDKIPLQFLASIENNTDTARTAFSYNIEADLPFIMSALEQNLNLKEDQTEHRLETENDDSDDEDDELPGCSTTPTSHAHRRRSPRAKSADSKLHKIKRRTIAKPVKFQLNLNASENEIRNYYMINSKKVDVKPTNLETIFEEGSPAVARDKFFGQRKRRSLNCSDGFNVNKTTAKARKNRVRRLLGSAPKHERMTMDTFLERLKAMQNESDDDGEPIVDPKLNQTV